MNYDATIEAGAGAGVGVGTGVGTRAETGAGAETGAETRAGPKSRLRLQSNTPAPGGTRSGTLSTTDRFYPRFESGNS